MGAPTFSIFDRFYSFFSWSGNANVKFYNWEVAITKKKYFYIFFLMERPYYTLKPRTRVLNLWLIMSHHKDVKCEKNVKIKLKLKVEEICRITTLIFCDIKDNVLGFCSEAYS